MMFPLVLEQNHGADDRETRAVVTVLVNYFLLRSFSKVEWDESLPFHSVNLEKIYVEKK